MTTNADVRQWRPDPNHLPGQPGERGTSAFTGDSTYNADGTLVSPSAPDRGPALGQYYTGGAAGGQVEHASDEPTYVRSTAGS